MILPEQQLNALRALFRSPHGMIATALPGETYRDGFTKASMKALVKRGYAEWTENGLLRLTRDGKQEASALFDGE